MSQSKSESTSISLKVSFTEIIKSTFEQKEKSPDLSFDHFGYFHGPNFFPWPPGSWMVDISSLSGINTMSWYQWYPYLMVSMVSIQWYQELLIPLTPIWYRECKYYKFPSPLRTCIRLQVPTFSFETCKNVLQNLAQRIIFFLFSVSDLF